MATFATVLDYKAAKKACHGHPKVREILIEEDGSEYKVELLVIKVGQLVSGRKVVVRCWSCGEKGNR